jgi:hypothetical protein
MAGLRARQGAGVEFYRINNESRPGEILGALFCFERLLIIKRKDRKAIKCYSLDAMKRYG